MKHLEHLVQELSKCPACLSPFQVIEVDGDKEDATNSPTIRLRLPTRSRTCHHRICQHCILKSQIWWHENNNIFDGSQRQHYHQTHHRGRSHRSAMLPCPKCSSPNSFPVNRPPAVDEDLLAALECLAVSFRNNNHLNARNRHHHRNDDVYTAAYSTLSKHCHRQPWRLPLGTYPHILETIANWKSVPLAVDTLREILQGGLMQVHDFQTTKDNNNKNDDKKANR
jgi:hypothetical protein